MEELAGAIIEVTADLAFGVAEFDGDGGGKKKKPWGCFISIAILVIGIVIACFYI